MSGSWEKAPSGRLVHVYIYAQLFAVERPAVPGLAVWRPAARLFTPLKAAPLTAVFFLLHVRCTFSTVASPRAAIRFVPQKNKKQIALPWRSDAADASRKNVQPNCLLPGTKGGTNVCVHSVQL